MARVIVTKDGKQVASGKNLEVLSRYARKHPVTWSVMSLSVLGSAKYGQSGRLKVHFKDGARAETIFNSFDVGRRWLAIKRQRSGWK